MNRYRKGQENTIFFHKGTDEYGFLGNMTGGYPFLVWLRKSKSPQLIYTSEHLYQALKFPDHPEVQSEILLDSPNGFKAKLIAKKHAEKTREDWEQVKEKAMAFSLYSKIQKYPDLCKRIPFPSGSCSLSIVEVSKKDRVWGAVWDQGEEAYIGHNRLGILWQEIFALVGSEGHKPPPSDGLILLGKEVGTFGEDTFLSLSLWIRRLLLRRERYGHLLCFQSRPCMGDEAPGAFRPGHPGCEHHQERGCPPRVYSRSVPGPVVGRDRRVPRGHLRG